MRPGSVPTPLVAGMGAAAAEAVSELEAIDLRRLRDPLEQAIVGGGDVDVLGARLPRLPNTSALRIRGVAAQQLVVRADRRGVCIGAGAACHSGDDVPSVVLRAMGMTDTAAFEVVRLSVGWNSDPHDVATASTVLRECVGELRQ